MKRGRWGALLLLAGGTAACGGSDDFESQPVDVSGAYTVAVTNQANDCALTGWEAGKQYPGIPLAITQTGATIQGKIEGLTGIAVALILGSATFEGSVDGDRVTATKVGSVEHNQAGCTFTVTMKMDATLTGDALQGRLEYTPNTTGSPECATLDGCMNVQDFSGSRPPK